MPKFPNNERILVKNIVANLSIIRRCDNEIIKEIERQTNKTITRKQIYNIRQQIKNDSYDWYKTMQQGKYEYLHEFKERINEILWLQKKHHELIESNKHNPHIQQSSLAEVHKLNITLANYFDVAPDIINGSTLSETSEKEERREKAINPEPTV